jgi:DNA-binding CsgD family transcriptional regulator
MASGAPQIAASYLRRALAEPPASNQRAQVLLELGRAEVRTGDATGLERILAAYEMTSEPVGRAQIALDLGRALALLDRAPQAIAVLDRARLELIDIEPELAQRLEAESIGAGIMNVSTSAAALQRLRGPGSSSRNGSVGSPVLLAYEAFASAAGGEQVDDAAGRAAHALDDARLIDERTLIPFCFAVATLAHCDRYALSLEALHRALDIAQRQGSSLIFALSSWLCSHVEYRRGAIQDAEAHARSSIEAGLEAWFTASVAFLADALIERGQLDEAAEAYRHHGLEGEIFPDLLIGNFLLSSRGRLRCLRADASAGLDDLLTCGRRLTNAGVVNPAIVAWRSDAALAHLQLGSVDEARALAVKELALARRFGAVRATGVALRTAGVVEMRAGSQRRGLDLLGEAVNALEDSGALLEHARSLVEHGAALACAGQADAGRNALRRGLDLASACGAQALTGRARNELIAAGGKPRRERSSGADALTASERRIAQMAAAGMSNRHIAEALFVTMNTVGKHLTHVYGKLNIASRAQLADSLVAGGRGTASGHE